MKRFFACTVLCAATAFGQAAPAPAGEVIGAGNFIHVVSNLDNSLAFYHDVIGLDLQPAGGARGNAAPAPPPAAPRPFITTPEVLHMYNAVGAEYRAGTAMIQESPMRAELIEFKGVQRNAVHPRFVDPGAGIFILTVKDLDPIIDRVRKTNTPVISVGGQPVSVGVSQGQVRALVVKDPDGFYVELLQPVTLPASAAQATNNVINTGFAFTVDNAERMMQLFKDAFGFQMEINQFTSDKGRMSLVSAPAGAQMRRAAGNIPGSSTRVEFLEYKGVDAKPVHSGTRDPGSVVLRLRIRDMDSMVKTLAANGIKVVSADSEPVPFNGQRFAITSAPDNLFVQVVQPAPAR
jgi:hypothetical protein